MSAIRDDTADIRDNQAEIQQKKAFGERLSSLLRDKSFSQADMVRITGESKSSISSYCKGDRTPQANTALALADALDTTVDYLILGRHRTVVTRYAVPVLDVRLAAGAGSLGAEELITGYMSLDDELMRLLGRSTTKGLVVMHAGGESNEPLIGDGAPVLIDEQDTHIKEGFIYAFRLGDALRIKRLRYNLTDIEAVSINPAYPPEIIPSHMRDQLKILGRAIFTFTRL